MIKDFKYFHWGIYPEDTPVYGLYEPVLDKFLLVLNSLEHAEMLKYLNYSRYGLYICRLDQASNFQEILIDNECCENWSFTNKTTDLYVDQVLHDLDPITVKEFCQSSDEKVWNIIEEKRWLMFCQHVLELLDMPDEQYYNKLFKSLGSFLNVEEFQNIQSISTVRSEILSALFLGSNIPDTQEQIKKILSRISQENLI
jgi:hypothetical protein